MGFRVSGFMGDIEGSDSHTSTRRVRVWVGGGGVVEVGWWGVGVALLAIVDLPASSKNDGIEVGLAHLSW